MEMDQIQTGSSSSSTSNLHFLSMEFCANCCEFLDPMDPLIEYNKDPLEIARCLSSLFKLHYLSAFVDPPRPENQAHTPTSKLEQELSVIWNGDLNVRLCAVCNKVLKDIWKLYWDFTQLTSAQSRLSQQIQQLDISIENCRLNLNSNKNQTIALLVPTSSPLISTDSKPKGRRRIIRHVQNKMQNPNQRTVVNVQDKDAGGVNKRNETVVAVPVAEPEPTPPSEVIKVDPEENSDEDVYDNDNMDCSPASPSGSENELGLFPGLNCEVQMKEEKEDVKEEMDSVEDGVEYSDDEEDDDNEDEDDDDEVQIILEKQPTSASTQGQNDHNHRSSTRAKRPYDEHEIRTSPKPRRTGTEIGKRDKVRQAIQKKQIRVYKSRKTRVPNPCWLCPRDFPTQEECYVHSTTEHADGKTEFCKTCSYPGIFKYSLSRHLQKCESLMPGQLLPKHQCSRCGHLYKTKITLATHVKEVHVNDEAPCKVIGCGFIANNLASLKNHMRSQHVKDPEEEKTCAECNRVFKTKALCTVHRNRMHTEEGHQKYKKRLRARAEIDKEKNRIRIANRSTVCDECQVDFLTNGALVHHRKMAHPGTFSFVCEICGDKFLRKEGLNNHMGYVHTDERPFVCDLCGASFKISTNLSAHIRRTHDEQGRLEYNAQTRLKNQRRKLIKQALAAKEAMEKSQSQEQTSTASTSEENK